MGVKASATSLVICSITHTYLYLTSWGNLKLCRQKYYVKDLASKTITPLANRKRECQDNLREIHQDYIYVETDRQENVKKSCAS